MYTQARSENFFFFFFLCKIRKRIQKDFFLCYSTLLHLDLSFGMYGLQMMKI